LRAADVIQDHVDRPVDPAQTNHHLVVGAQLAGDLRQRPYLLDDPVGQVGRQAGKPS